MSNEAFKALMPEPVGAFRDKGSFTMKEDFYTADQMRQMFDAATERAAKLAEDQAEFHQEMHNSQAEQAADACAAAIRAGGEQT